MKFQVTKGITHVSLDGVHYPVRDGVVEVPAGRLSQELERLGYEPVAEAPPPPGLVFEAEVLEADVAPPPPAVDVAPLPPAANAKTGKRKK